MRFVPLRVNDGMDRIAPPLIRSPRVRVRVIYAYEKSYSRERFFFCCALRNVNPGSFNMQVYNIEWEPKNMTKGFVDVKGSWLLVYLPLLIELMEEYYCERSKNLDKLTRLVTNIKAHGWAFCASSFWNKNELFDNNFNSIMTSH